MNIFEALSRGLTTTSPEATHRLAAELSEALPPEAWLGLLGDLGSGKTTFVQGLAAAFGVRQAVTSPTFALMSLHQGHRQLVHVDAYRLTRPRDFEALLIDEFLQPPFCVVVEWADRVREALPLDTLWLHLSRLGDGQHHLQLRLPSC